MDRYDCQFMDEPFPIGFQATKEWLLKLGDFFDCTEQAKQIIQKEEKTYRKEIERLKPALAGKRILLTTINSNMDWMIEAAQDIGMEFVWIGVLNYLRQTLQVTAHPERYRIEEEFDLNTIHAKIKEHHPDIILSNYTSTVQEGDYVVESMPMTPVVGFHSALHIIHKWADSLKISREGEWKDDKKLFEKYYA
jgi:nitrogenase molybdenum-iron protein alpha/beta subunit